MCSPVSWRSSNSFFWNHFKEGSHRADTDQVRQIRSESSCQTIQKEIIYFKYFIVLKKFQQIIYRKCCYIRRMVVEYANCNQLLKKSQNIAELRLFLLPHLKFLFLVSNSPASFIFNLLYALIWIIQLQWKIIKWTLENIIWAFPLNILRLWIFSILSDWKQ